MGTQDVNITEGLRKWDCWSPTSAHGEGRIAPDEMPIEPRTDPKVVRDAPSFSTALAGRAVSRPYTVEALAKFLGLVRNGTGEERPKDSFVAAFGALELKTALPFQCRCDTFS
jgi:hypothetical protein